MSDTDLRTTRQPSSQDVSDKLQKAGGDIKESAGEMLASASEAARGKLDELGAAAKDTATQAADKVRHQVGAQQQAGADYAQRLAGNLRNAARSFETDTPLAARTIETAADYIEDAAGKVRNGSLGDVVDGMTSFAKRQPAAFLGLSVLAGFAAIRFLKASSSASAGASRSGEGRT
jgi:uncharacterized protein YjbJ (UPF0337 family)